MNDADAPPDAALPPGVLRRADAAHDSATGALPHENAAPNPPDAPAAAPLSAGAAAASAGAQLRAARLAQGVHIGALAVTLKVPVKKLEALEADQYAFFADPVFVRALAGSVCRALHCDPTAVLAALPQTTTAGLQSDLQGLQTAFHDAPQARHLQSNRPLWWGGATLAVAIGAVLAWPRSPASVASDAPALPLAAPSPSPAATPAPAALSLNPAAPGAPAQPASDPASAAALAQTASAPGSVGQAANQAFTPVQTAMSATKTIASSGVASAPAQRVELLLQIDDTCWVEVQSASGERLLRRSASAGETLRLAGVAPLAVVLGRADRVRASVGGRAIDLRPYLKDGPVARFEVQP